MHELEERLAEQAEAGEQAEAALRSQIEALGQQLEAAKRQKLENLGAPLPNRTFPINAPFPMIRVHHLT